MAISSGYQFSLANVLKDVQYFRGLGDSSELSAAIENVFANRRPWRSQRLARFSIRI